MGNKKRTGLWIPIEISADKKLDWTNKALLAEIYSLCELKEGCIASDSHFGRFLGLGRSSVNKRIKYLKEQGYISTKNQFKNGLCIGRIITKSSSVEKHTPVPKEDTHVSEEIQGVVPEVYKDSSIQNTTNTITNSDILKQKSIQNTGEGENISYQTLNVYYQNRLEDLVYEIVNKSSLGEEIFKYMSEASIDQLRYAVDHNEFRTIQPLIKKYIVYDKQLYGK